MVITECDGIGTHKGDFLGLAPTGRILRTPVCNVIEIRDNKIFAEREYMDTGLMMKKLQAEDSTERVAAE